MHRISGQTVDQLLNERLFQPMRFAEAAWSRCPQGFPIGATGLYLSAGDMVKLGALYRDGGVYEGKRLLSQAWTRRATSPIRRHWWTISIW